MIRDTSITAYLSIPDLSRRERMVLQTIEAYPDRTDGELSFLMGFKERNAVAPRRNQLEKDMLVADSGVRACTRSGKKCHVWHITRKGREALSK